MNRACWPADRSGGKAPIHRSRLTIPVVLTSALALYFQGDLGAIDPLPVEMTGTPFQTSVWRAPRKIRPWRISATQSWRGASAGPRPSAPPVLPNGQNPDQHRRAVPSRHRLRTAP